MSTPPVTGQAIRETLLAAGYPEHVSGTVSGFHTGEGDTEVLVEYLRGPDAGTAYTDKAKARELATLDRYDVILTRAGYQADRAWHTHGARLIIISKENPS